MEDDEPVYIVTFTLNPENSDRVDINVRMSEEPESTAETHSISVDELRNIFLERVDNPPDQIGKGIGLLHTGRSFQVTVNSLSALRRIGLLGPAS